MAPAPDAVAQPLDQVLPPPFDSRHGERKFLTRLGTKAWRAESRAIALSEVYSFADWLATDGPADAHDVRHASVHTVVAYRDHLYGLGLSAATVKLALICLRVYYDFITGDKNSPDNPARKVALPDRDLPDTQPYTTTEVRAVLETIVAGAARARDEHDLAAWMLARRDYAMICVLYYTGIRRGELRRLRLRDLDLRTREMHIKGKGEKARTIRFPRVLHTVLSDYLDQVRAATSSWDFLFCELDATTTTWVSSGSDADVSAGRYISPQVREQARNEDDDYGLAPYTLARRGNQWGRLAGVEGNHGPHRWRHGWGSTAAQAGVSLVDIGAHLGHSLSNREQGLGWNPVTLDYIHLSPDYLHQVVADALPDPLSIAGLV